MNKQKWTWWGLSSFFTFLAWELFAIYDGNEDTYTLTTAIITYVSPWIALPIIIGGCSWIVWHFVTYYYNYRIKKR